MRLRFNRLNLETIIFIIFACLVAILIIFVYFPKKNAVDRLRTELKQKEQSIKNFQSKIGVKGPQEMLNIRMNYQKAKTLFPKVENKREILKYISSRANLLGLKIVSLQLGEQELYFQQSGQANIGERNLYRMSIKGRFLCSYSNLGKYLKDLEIDSPYLIRMERMRISKPPNSIGDLNVDINLEYYFRGK